MFSATSSGNWEKTRRFLTRSRQSIFGDLHSYGQLGVEALRRATPKDSGLSADSWGYRIIKDSRGPGIEWYNTNVTSYGQPIVILIQYGHATKDGGYIEGRDFINPAMQPIFDKIVNELWKKVRQ